MIYLKRFNESIEDTFLIELQKFCNDNLAYLIDDGFVIPVKKVISSNNRIQRAVTSNRNQRNSYVSDSKYVYSIHIMLNTFDEFKWSDIENDFIPFYTMLKSKYELEYVTAFNRETDEPIPTNNYILISGWNALPDSRIDDFDSESSKNVSFVKILVKGYN